MKELIILSVIILSCIAQRSPYAGSRPIGYPYMAPTVISSTTPNLLDDRLGDDSSTTTTKLPIEALGNAELVNRLNKLPNEYKPFWLLNWQALENQRKNPQTYQQNANIFIDNNA